MTGPVVVLIVLAIAAGAGGLAHVVPAWLERRRMRGAPIADEQRFRREHSHLIAGYEPPDARHSYIVGADTACCDKPISQHDSATHYTLMTTEEVLKIWPEANALLQNSEGDAARRARRVK